MSAVKVMVGMSGGVDSSVTALLLKQQGLDIAGLFMKNWEEDDRFGTCPAEQDALDAQAVADLLKIPLHTRNFAAEYWDEVFENFLSEYRAGRTPNPDVLCNREIKFKTFLEHAHDLGAQKIATGHYARVGNSGGEFQLLKGADLGKDQSYFLYTLGQAQLASTLFPVGELPKAKVRELAVQAGVPVANKKDSTGICFIGERDFREFLSQYIPAKTGVMQTPEGEVIGEHTGIAYFTIGQRGGLGIGGIKSGSGEPWFVVGKIIDKNILIVAQGHDHPALFASKLKSEKATWVSGNPPAAQFTCTAKTRYRQADQACQVTVQNTGELLVEFEQPQRAVTPGQSLVLYQDQVCLGGAIISISDARYGGWQ